MAAKLSQREIERYHQLGVVDPFELFSPKEAGRIKKHVRAPSKGRGPNGTRNAFRHLDCSVIYEACAQPEVIERMAQLMGPDLVLWRTQLFWKRRREKEIPWHQDFANWPIARGHTVSAWIALDDATRRNGCLEMLPGQNKRPIEQYRAPGFERFKYQMDLGPIDVTRSEHMEVRAGQFLLFDDLIPHRSGRNRTWGNRLAIAMRVTRPEVPINGKRLFPEFRVLLLRGTHENGANSLGEPPTNSA